MLTSVSRPSLVKFYTLRLSVSQGGCLRSTLGPAVPECSMGLICSLGPSATSPHDSTLHPVSGNPKLGALVQARWPGPSRLPPTSDSG